MFLLVLARMSGLVRQEERAVARQRALRRAGVALVGAADDRPDRGRPRRRRARAGRRGAPTRASSPERGSRRGRVSPAVRRVAAGAAAGRGPGALDRRADRAARRARAGPRAGYALIALAGRGSRQRLLLVGIPGATAASVGALETLATQMSLAIEGASWPRTCTGGRSEARFRALLEHSSDLIAVLDRGGDDRLPEPVDRARCSAMPSTMS